MPDQPSRRPLVVTDDPELLDDLLRLAAAAAVEVEVASDAAAARRAWATAPLVVVADDLAEAVRRSEPPRRAGVVLVGSDLDDASVWPRAVGLGAEHVVFLPDAQAWLVDRFADAIEPASSARTVCVVGGRGGAGATTLAAVLGLVAVRRGLNALLLDADPLGGGVDLALGGEDTAGLRWPDLAGSRGRLGSAALHEALPRFHELTVLSWDRGDRLVVPPEAMRAVLDAAGRGADLVVVDLPRRPDAAAEEALARATTTLLVVPAEVRATASAARVAAAVAPLTADLRVVVRGPAPGGLEPELVADALGLPLAGHARAEPGLAETLERGEPPGVRPRSPLGRLASSLLDELLRVPTGRAA